METAAPPPALTQNHDEEHLKLLAIFHYVVAGIGALLASIPLIHVGMGIMLLTRPGAFNSGQSAEPAPEFVGYLFIAIGATFVVLGWLTAICTVLSGRYLAKRRKRTFSFVIAAVLCLFVPFGTVLGVFTIMVLSRESVQRLYAKAAQHSVRANA